VVVALFQLMVEHFLLDDYFVMIVVTKLDSVVVVVLMDFQFDFGMVMMVDSDAVKLLVEEMVAKNDQEN
jgi:hypothetical protein